MGKRANIQLCYPFEEKRLAKWSPPYIVQPKLDGERCRALLNCGNVAMLSSEENLIGSVPKIFSGLVKLSLMFSKNPIELDGELYRHGMTFEDVHSIVGRTVNLNPEHDQMQYHVFDIVDETMVQAKRIKLLQSLPLKNNPYIKIVPTRIAWNLEDIRKIFDEYIKLDYEGIIVRHFEAPYVRRRSIWAMKFKPKKSDTYPITGFVEGLGKYKGTIGAIICSTDDFKFEVGSFSLPDEQRHELWQRRFTLTKFDCKVGYQHRWASGKPKSGVFLELVERAPEVKFQNPLGV